jgi:hypothetical protein
VSKLEVLTHPIKAKAVQRDVTNRSSSPSSVQESMFAMIELSTKFFECGFTAAKTAPNARSRLPAGA